MTSIKEIAVVGCSDKKHEGSHTAERLYAKSDTFRKNLAAALTDFDREDVFILSAKYGLVSLDAELDSYNVRMGDAESVRVADLTRSMAELDLLEADVYVFSSKLYVDALTSAAAEFDRCLVHNVYEGNRGIGDQRRGADIISGAASGAAQLQSS